jgi:hypothetical protein
MTYRKIDTRIWNDEAFRKLTDDGKLAFIFLLTHPAMTSLGAMRGTVPGLAAELKWTEKRLRAATEQMRMVRIDEVNCMLWLPNFLKYNQPESPNVVKHWLHAAEALPECEMKVQVLARAQESLKQLSEAFQEAFRQAFAEGFHKPFGEDFRKSMANQEQEQEQEQKQEKKKEAPPFVLPSWVNSEIWEAFIEMRRKLKKPPTEYAIEQLIKKLAKLRDAGEDISVVLNKSIVSGWPDVYPTNGRGNNGGKPEEQPRHGHRNFDYRKARQ